MARTYTLKCRAQRQAETRQRIIEAAVDLHSSIGPGFTTFSMIAERAGVQRHTLYAHFPDERSLTLACSGMVMKRDPLPDAEQWRAIGDQGQRLRTGLKAIYGWYERNAKLTACVLRDAEHHPLIKEIAELRMGTFMAVCEEVLGGKLHARGRTMLRLALSFFTWRTLSESGLRKGAAAEAMVRAVEGADKR